jgi:hypothetical protein
MATTVRISDVAQGDMDALQQHLGLPTGSSAVAFALRESCRSRGINNVEATE